MGSRDIETPKPVPPPDILFYHILPRLPGKSVHRFLCVCKQWQSFLTTPMFAKMHLQHRHPLIIALSTTRTCKFSTIDMEASQNMSDFRPLPFKVSHQYVSIVGTVRGPVCLRMTNRIDWMDIILWNPLTGEYKTVYRPKNQRFYQTTNTLIGLYYRCNDYKILLVTKDCNAFLYSLKSDSWRKVERRTTQREFNCSFRPNDDWTQQYVVFDEKMYFITRNVKQCWPGSCFIIRFDLKTEQLREISGPKFSNVVVIHELCLWVVKGCIDLWAEYNIPFKYKSKDIIGVRVSEIWRMDGDEDWTMVSHEIHHIIACKGSSLDSQISPTRYSVESLDMRFVHPLEMMNNEKCMLLHDEHNHKIYKLDIEKEEEEAMTEFSYDPKETTVFTAGGGGYIETLGINIARICGTSK